jgi:hypothetical protein
VIDPTISVSSIGGIAAKSGAFCQNEVATPKTRAARTSGNFACVLPAKPVKMMIQAIVETIIAIPGALDWSQIPAPREIVGQKKGGR